MDPPIRDGNHARPAIERYWRHERRVPRAAQGAPPDPLAALGYDAALVLFDAIERAPSLDGADLTAAIAATTLEGATGGITFGGRRDPAKPVVVLQMKAQMPHFAAAITP